MWNFGDSRLQYKTTWNRISFRHWQKNADKKGIVKNYCDSSFEIETMIVLYLWLFFLPPPPSLSLSLSLSFFLSSPPGIANYHCYLYVHIKDIFKMDSKNGSDAAIENKASLDLKKHAYTIDHGKKSIIKKILNHTNKVISYCPDKNYRK